MQILPKCCRQRLNRQFSLQLQRPAALTTLTTPATMKPPATVFALHWIHHFCAARDDSARAPCISGWYHWQKGNMTKQLRDSRCAKISVGDPNGSGPSADSPVASVPRMTTGGGGGGHHRPAHEPPSYTTLGVLSALSAVWRDKADVGLSKFRCKREPTWAPRLLRHHIRFFTTGRMRHTIRLGSIWPMERPENGH